MDSEAVCSVNCLPKGTQVGEYRLLEVIGEGGFGIVYKALDLALDREVALKEYMPAALAGRQNSQRVHVRSQHRGAFDAGMRSFINEARLLARFSHPTLVHVYRFFENGGTAYMVMRRYEGQTLGRALESSAVSRPVNQDWLGALLAPVLDVLEILHAEDCFHRDIAPDNIFVQRDGRPVLLDFGAARRIISDMTQALTMVLKPGFAPIEQYVDDGTMPQGAWTDIYQVGALMHWAITGKTPPTSVARMVNDPLLPLTPAQAPGFSGQFMQGMHFALQVLPQDRPQSIAELRAALGLTAPARAVSASPPPPPPPPPPPTAVAAPEEDAPQARTVDESVPSASAEMAVAGVVQAGDVLQGLGPEAIDGEWPSAPSPELETARAPEPAGAASASSATAGVEASPPHGTPPRTRLGKPALLAACALGVALLVLTTWWWLAPPSAQEQADTLVASPSAEGRSAEEQLAWQQARDERSVPRLQAYLDSFPQGAHHTEVQALLAQLGQDLAPPVAALPPLANATQPAKPAVPQAAVVAAASAGGDAQRRPPSHEPPAAVTAAAEPARTEPVKTESAVGQEAAAATGKVIFKIAPWGYVSVNNAASRTSPPLTQLDLPEGEYRIEITNPVSTTPVTQTVLVRQGAPVTIKHRFE